MAFDARDFFVRFIRAMDAKDYASLEAMFHPDFVADTPQSGERTRGFAGFRSQLDQYPDGGVQTSLEQASRLLPREDRWAITPSYTVVPLRGKNDFTMLMRLQYPDGSWWHVVLLVEIRDELLYRVENYFAPEMPAPLAQSIAANQHG